jgi:protein-L-isoaspartate(D-aspartate) O-methyltransferase
MAEYAFEQMRHNMVASQLRTTGVNDPGVIAAMDAVAREEFVPQDRIALAYADAFVPLGHGRNLNTPMSFGRLLAEAAPEAGDRTLLIGAATGYAAAVLAQLVASVIAVEENPLLVATARQKLKQHNVKLIEGPLAKGYAPGAPYDLILFDGAIEYVPDAIISQLVESGRLVAAILDKGVARISIGRRGGAGFGMVAVSDAISAILPGFAKSREFIF